MELMRTRAPLSKVLSAETPCEAPQQVMAFTVLNAPSCARV